MAIGNVGVVRLKRTVVQTACKGVADVNALHTLQGFCGVSA